MKIKGLASLSALVMLLISPGCTLDESVDLLVGEFKIADSMDSVSRKLATRGFEYIVVESSHLSDEDPRPEFSVVVWEAEKIELLGVEGRAMFSFLNNRLLQIVFTPGSTSELLTLVGELGVNTVQRTRERGDLKVTLVDAGGLPKRLVFEAKSLIHERDDWIARYS